MVNLSSIFKLSEFGIPIMLFGFIVVSFGAYSLMMNDESPSSGLLNIAVGFVCMVIGVAIWLLA